MIDAGVIVRVGCASCSTFFDVDLRAIEQRRGRAFSLIDGETSCKVTRCRGRNFFVAATSMNAVLVTLVNSASDPLQINGRRAIDLEPPDDPPPSVPALRFSAA